MPELHEKVQIVGLGGDVAVVQAGVLRTVAGASVPVTFLTRKVHVVGSDGSVAGVSGGAISTSGG